MAEPLARFELVVGHLADQLGPNRDPFRVLAPRPSAEAARHSAGIHFPLLFGDLGLQRLELRDQFLAFGGVERRRVAHVVHRAFLVVKAEQKRA